MFSNGEKMSEYLLKYLKCSFDIKAVVVEARYSFITAPKTLAHLYVMFWVKIFITNGQEFAFYCNWVVSRVRLYNPLHISLSGGEKKNPCRSM